MARGLGALTDLEYQFCQLYTADPKLSAIQAVKNAGYSERSAPSIASEIMTFPRVRAELSRLNEERFERLDYQAMEALRETIKIAHSDIGDFMEEVEVDTGEVDFLDQPITATARRLKPFSRMENTGAISSIKQTAHGVDIKLWDKSKALDLLLKHFNLLTDDKNFNINVSNSTDLSVLTDEELAKLSTIQAKLNK